jgi:ATP-dependent Clp protease ATP-binding subunit ClpA
MELNEKITLEKRKRHQIYTTLNYLRSHKNKFDFFSSDAITILKLSKEITKKFKQDKLSPEILLLSFFNCESELTDILRKYKITFQTIKRYIIHGHNLQDEINNELISRKNPGKFSIPKVITFFKTNFKKKILITSNIGYNYETKNILDKAIENAYRFKTPVITPEIIFLTILEEKENSAGQLLKLLLENDLNWNLLRYEILKKLHNQETQVQGKIFKNTRYYAYLLKIEMVDEQFEKLIEKNDFPYIVSAYRDLVISKVLDCELFETLEKEIKYSIKINRNNRKYSL